ncbi:hypothetical protein HanPI659440_Chr13g0488601 [Helianthus annuus]|nr:hypothetical protein HanPI659440_Chr13g0488601 [Helianthus annuus]
MQNSEGLISSLHMQHSTIIAIYCNNVEGNHSKKYDLCNLSIHKLINHTIACINQFVQHKIINIRKAELVPFMTGRLNQLYLYWMP